MSHSPLGRKFRQWYKISLASPALESSGTADISRRDFVRNSAAAMLTAAPFARALASGKSPLSTDTKIAIVGAGIAGLSAAFELSKHGLKPSIYEASGRLGGRMLTLPSFNSDGMSIELGGEFVDSDHATITSLCREFGIPLDAYIDEDKGLEQNLYYFKDRYYTDRDAIRALKSIAALIKSDVAQITKPAGAEKFDKIKLSTYLASFNGKTEAWFLDLLRVGMLAEAGYDSDQLPAIDLLLLLGTETSDGFKIYGSSDQSRCLRGGTVALINALRERLKTRGVEVQMSHRLAAIATSAHGIKLTFQNDKKTVDVFAHKVICTIPFPLLREVSGIKTLGLRPQKLDCIEHLVYSPAGKIIIGYKSRSWRKPIHSGEVRVPASNGMVYSDLRTQNTWEASRTQKGLSGILTHFVGGNEGKNLDQTAQPAMNAATEKIFPGMLANLDGHSVAWNWAKFPLSYGAYSSNQPGDFTRFGKVASMPELNGSLHFAGEHTSEKFSGFMEGGAESGVRAALACLKKA